MTTDILMITYNRPEYTRLALGRLLETCDESMRVWVWHNGIDAETLDVVRSMQEHPRLYKIHHSEVNQKLTAPTNWLWSNSDAEYVSKVDDDCLMPYGWGEKLRSAHAACDRLGAIGCWRFQDEDFDPELSAKKIRQLSPQHSLLENCWVEGSGYLLKRRAQAELGLLRKGQSWGNYAIRLAMAGWVNGWHYPFLYQEHMDDPRAEHTLIRTDSDLNACLPLSARNFGVNTVDAWVDFLRADALVVQRASVDPRQHLGWRARARRIIKRLSSKGKHG